MNDYVPFRDWATKNGYAPDLTLDRIDVNGNYEPSNCRWVTHAEQMRNRRNSVLVEYNGETGCLKDMCKKLNVSNHVVAYRMKKGYSFADAIDKFDHTSPYKEYVYEK